jgi:hypothetical protein
MRNAYDCHYDVLGRYRVLHRLRIGFGRAAGFTCRDKPSGPEH